MEKYSLVKDGSLLQKLISPIDYRSFQETLKGIKATHLLPECVTDSRFHFADFKENIRCRKVFSQHITIERVLTSVVSSAFQLESRLKNDWHVCIYSYVKEQYNTITGFFASYTHFTFFLTR